ncbi:hypothetical protein R1sor_027362 [Riccia sorocarpa]|uniref:VOC domain-containing protein n=1 Tax=Riccia sorocarpa TaxID=122646 RepID=A0ABD3GG48_9MARC
MTNVDVLSDLSDYMTAAAEIVAESSRADRLSPYISTTPTEHTPDSTIISEDMSHKLPLSQENSPAPSETSSQECEPVSAAQGCILKDAEGLAETRIEFQQPVPVANDLMDGSSSVRKLVEQSGETGPGASIGTEASEVKHNIIEMKELNEEPAVTEYPHSKNPVDLSTAGAAEIMLTKTEVVEDDGAGNLAINHTDGYVGNSEGQTTGTLDTEKYSFQFTGLNHVAFCCESLERSLEFYCGLLGLTTNLDRPELSYRGAWLFLGAEGIHIMEVPNPDPVKGRPAHGGRDRHACLNVTNVDHLKTILERAGIEYQLSQVPSIFCRDPDGNGLEFIEV